MDERREADLTHGARSGHLRPLDDATETKAMCSEVKDVLGSNYSCNIQCLRTVFTSDTYMASYTHVKGYESMGQRRSCHQSPPDRLDTAVQRYQRFWN